MFNRRRRRDWLVVQLAGQLAESREREAVLREQNEWFRAALGDVPYASGASDLQAVRRPGSPLHVVSRMP